MKVEQINIAKGGKRGAYMKATHIIRKWLYGSDYLLAVFYGTHAKKNMYLSLY